MSKFRQIKASAGSGKTYTLTASFLSLLAGASDASWTKASGGCAMPESDGNYGWQELLAITFTNKAAAEMRLEVRGKVEVQRAEPHNEMEQTVDGAYVQCAVTADEPVHGRGGAFWCPE